MTTAWITIRPLRCCSFYCGLVVLEFNKWSDMLVICCSCNTLHVSKWLENRQKKFVLFDTTLKWHMTFFHIVLILEYILKMYLCLDILSQSIRKSGFGASDELSSEEEEGSPVVEESHSISHQERHPATAWPTAPASSLRKRNLMSNPQPILRAQVIVAPC